MLRLFGEKSWVGPEPFLSYYLCMCEKVCMIQVSCHSTSANLICDLFPVAWWLKDCIIVTAAIPVLAVLLVTTSC